MPHAVLLGDPSYFRIKGGNNPYTRDRWGVRKRVNRSKAIHQWKVFKELLEKLGAKTFVMPAHRGYPGLVFPANAGFLFPKYEPLPREKKTFYLSNLLAHRTGEQVLYRDFFSGLGFPAGTLPYLFEGEADFFPCGEHYIFTYGNIVPTGFAPKLGWPLWEYRFSHRSDVRNLDVLKTIVSPREVIPVRLTDVHFYHGDTVFFAFGEKREFLLAYLEAVDPESRERLAHRFGSRLIPLPRADAAQFAANSFQLDTPQGPHLILPAGVSEEVKQIVSRQGFPYTCVDVSEFFQKGGGSIKCMLADLGPFFCS